MNEFVLPAGPGRKGALARLILFLNRLDLGSKWILSCKVYRKTRSNDQNAYLWGVCYATILEEGVLEGWTADDLHDYFLGEHFGWKEYEGFGRKKIKPIRRSSKLSTTEFMDYVDFIQRTMAGKGVYIPDPNEEFDG